MGPFSKVTMKGTRRMGRESSSGLMAANILGSSKIIGNKGKAG